MGTRCDEVLSTLGLPSTSTLLLSHTHAALNWMTVQQWRRRFNVVYVENLLSLKLI
jgi:hypothetical protein